MSVPVTAVLALVIAFLGTRLALVLARRRRVIAIPNERSSHAVPTPSAGGVGICVALAVGLAVGLIGGPDASLAWAAVALLVAGWVGWRDDVRPLPPVWKMLLLTAAAGGLLTVTRIDGVALPYAGLVPFGALAAPLTLFWLAGFTNAFNFMDGIDGVAAITALVSGAAFAAAGIGHGDTGLAVLGSVTAAAATGFLPWNFPRAQIFMGDTGSLPLGLALALCAVRAADRGSLPFAACVLLLGPFVFDTSFTLVRRALRGERLWRAHREHLYQRLARRLGSHVPVTVVYAILSCVTAVLALTYDDTAEFGRLLCLGVPLVAMLAFAAVIVRREGTGQSREPGTRPPAESGSNE